ncbi:MlaD family protein [Rickettsiales bacterium]|nr:MlaD family protein [Rickettsiales bacterium]
MKKNYFETVLGIIIIFFSLFAIIKYYNANSLDFVNESYKLEAKFLKIGGIVIGNDVKLSGVKIGTVTNIGLNDEYFAVVDLSINKEINIPSDSVISINSEGLLGNKYLAITPGSSEKVDLKPNQEIKNVLDYQSIEDQVSKIIFLATQ